MEKNIYIIHENDEWLIPLRESFRKINAAFLYAQLSELVNIQSKRKQIWDYYNNELHSFCIFKTFVDNSSNTIKKSC